MESVLTDMRKYAYIWLEKKEDVLTVETGQGSSETATQEAAAVDYGSAACGREDVWSTSELAWVSLSV